MKNEHAGYFSISQWGGCLGRRRINWAGEQGSYPCWACSWWWNYIFAYGVACTLERGVVALMGMCWIISRGFSFITGCACHRHWYGTFLIKSKLIDTLFWYLHTWSWHLSASCWQRQWDICLGSWQHLSHIHWCQSAQWLGWSCHST